MTASTFFTYTTLFRSDKLRIVVFGQDTLSNTYTVDAAGQVSMPLIGAVQARDATTAALSAARSEEHTSELQSQSNLVCRLLLEKKNSATPWTGHPDQE